MNKFEGKKILAILPAYNVEDRISAIVSRTLKFVDQVIVITDGSTDRTREKSIKAGALSPIQLMRRGKGNAVRRGITESKKHPSNIIVLMDADGQHIPEEIPLLISPLVKDGYDMAIGSRMKGNIRTSLINLFGNMGLKIISFLVTLKWISDTESGFRSFKTKKLYSLKLKAKRYEIESELMIRGLKNGFSYIEVPITVPQAIPGVTVMDGLKCGFYKLKYGLERS